MNKNVPPKDAPTPITHTLVIRHGATTVAVLHDLGTRTRAEIWAWILEHEGADFAKWIGRVEERAVRAKLSAPLSERQDRIARMVARGVTYPDMGRVLGCSAEAARNEVRAIAKLLPHEPDLTPYRTVALWAVEYCATTPRAA